MKSLVIAVLCALATIGFVFTGYVVASVQFNDRLAIMQVAEAYHRDMMQRDIRTLQNAVEGLKKTQGQAGTQEVLGATSVAFQKQFDEIDYYAMVSRSWNDKGGNRRIATFSAYDAKIALAQIYLAKGQIGQAKTLALEALASLGIVGCDKASANVFLRDFPADLIALVEEDVAPVYSFDQEGGGVTIRYQSKNPGC